MSGAPLIPFSEFFLFGLAHDFSKETICWLWEDFSTIDQVWAEVANAHHAAQKPTRQTTQ